MFVGVAADAQAAVFDAGFGGDESGGDLFGGHFEAEHGDGCALPEGGVAGDGEGEGGFADGGAGGEDEQVGAVDAAVEQAVEVAEAGAGGAGGVGGGVGGFLQDVDEQVLEHGEFAALLGAADGIEFFDGFVQGGVDVGVGAVGEFADVAGGAEHVAVGGGALNDAGVVFGADGGGEFGDEGGDVGLTADFVDPAFACEFGGGGDGVDGFAAVPEFERGVVEQAVAGVEEVALLEDVDDALEDAGFGEDCADHGALGGDVLGHAAARAGDTGRIGRAGCPGRCAGFAGDHRPPPVSGAARAPGSGLYGCGFGFGCRIGGSGRFCSGFFGLEFFDHLIDGRLDALLVGFDEDADVGEDVAGEADADFFGAELAEGLGELDLAVLDGCAGAFGEALGDVARGDGAEEAALLADAGAEDEFLAVDGGGERRGGFVELALADSVGLGEALGAGEVVGGGGAGETAGQEVVAGKAIFDLLDLTDLRGAFDLFKEHDLHGASLQEAPPWHSVRQRRGNAN